MTLGATSKAFLVSRIGLLLLAYVGLRWYPLSFTPEEWRAFPGTLWLDGWARFDSGWYWSIIERGYQTSENGQANAAFFPLYPLLVYPLSLPLRAVWNDAQSFYAAGILVSHVAFGFALAGVGRLGSDLVGRPAADRAVWLIALYPFSYFFSAAYTEALYLALAVWAFCFGHHNRWAVAYTSVVFPLFLTAGALLVRRRVYRMALLVFIPLLALFTWWFNNWHLAI